MGVANSVCCGDFKVSVNQALITISYPLPIPDDLFATLAGGRVFSKLDLSNAYQQLKLTTESQKYLTINTHTHRFVHISTSRVWHCVGAVHLPGGHGSNTARDGQCSLLLRRHTDHFKK